MRGRFSKVNQSRMVGDPVNDFCPKGMPNPGAKQDVPAVQTSGIAVARAVSIPVPSILRRIIAPVPGDHRIVVVHQDAVRWSLHILVLTGPNCPEEGHPDNQDDDKRDRDEQIKDFHADIVAVARDPTRPMIRVCQPSRAGRITLAGGSAELCRPDTTSRPSPRNRSAFPTTIRELRDMPRAASHGVNRPVAATGRASAL